MLLCRGHTRLCQGNGQSGSVLIVVIAVCAVLVAALLYLSQTAILYYRAAENNVASIQAYQAIEGAIRYLTNYLANYVPSGSLPSREDLQLEAVPVGEALWWAIGRDPSGNSTTVYFGIVDEASKINLNAAPLEVLLGLPRMTEELAESILDWRDEDEEPHPNGAESITYAMGVNGYRSKNGRFDSVEELRLVKGCTFDILYGEDWNRNGALDPSENDGSATFPPDDADGVLEPGLIEYLTVWSREPNRRSDGSARININTQREQLRQLLQDVLGEQRANEIMGRIGLGGNFRSVLEFYIRSGMTIEEFMQIEDALTVSDEQLLYGLVNVATASETVFSALAGGDQSVGAKLVSYRSTLTEEARRTVAWVADAVDEQTALMIGPFLTARSYQFALDIVAVGRNQRGYARVLVIVDLADGEPKVVYRKDLTGLGWALGTQMGAQLSSLRLVTR